MYLFLRNNLNRIMKSYLYLILVFSLSINLFAQNPDKPNMSLRELKQNFDITQLSDSLLSSFTLSQRLFLSSTSTPAVGSSNIKIGG